MMMGALLHQGADMAHRNARRGAMITSRPAMRPVWGLGLSLWLLCGANEAHAQTPPPRMDAPTMSTDHSTRPPKPVECTGGGALTTLLPLLLMAAVGVGLYFIIRRASQPRHPTGYRYPLSAPVGYPPDRSMARNRDVDLLYHQTIEQLGSDNAEVRIGALHTLGRLAWENPRLHQSVCGTLDGFIRTGLGKLPEDLPPHKVPNDIQTAQTIFGQMTSRT
jgi:hypothetical protein